MSARLDNLPILSTSFVGREKELAEIVDLLRGPDCRLLTLTGSGGSGKTRLALEAAARLRPDFAGGVAFIPLQAVSDPVFIAPAIAQPVGLALHGPRDADAQLLDYLRDRELLLVLDNFEHLLNGAALVSNILATAPGVKALVTSREILNLQEEWIRPVVGLTFPNADQTASAEELAPYSAVQLFSERARQVQHTFSLEKVHICVAHICRLVEGLPLALELAATWLRTLTCQEVAHEIERNLDFLETTLRNVPARHRSMRAVFQQSWDLLNSGEQETLARLSVFRGGCTRDAATAVAGATLACLQGLVDKSLLVITPAGRYEIHELVRQYAAEQLADKSTALEETLDRHITYFSTFLEEQEPELKFGAQQEALRVIDSELDNLRVAWRRAVNRRAVTPIEQAMGALFLYYQMHGRLEEGLASFRAASRTLAGGEDILHLKLKLLETWFESGVASAPAPTVRFYQQAFAQVRQLGQDEAMAMPLCLFAWAAGLIGDVSPLRQFYSANYRYHRQNRNTWAMAWASYSLGVFPSMMYGDKPSDSELTEGLRYLEESRALFREVGNLWASTYAVNAAAQMLMDLKEYERAREMFRESLQICREIGDPGGVAFALHGLGEAARGLQEYEGSWRYLNDALQVSYAHSHHSEMVIWHLFEMASAFSAAGRQGRALEILAFLHKETSNEWLHNFTSERLDELSATVPEETFIAARRYGEQIDLETLVQTLGAEFGGMPDSDLPTPTTAADGEPQPPLVESLSERELEVLRLVAEGLSNKEIAERLTVTVGTVKKHLNNIFGKLQVTSRTQAVARARMQSLIR